MQRERSRMTESEGRAWMEALRDAAQVGVADVKAVRIQTFDSPKQINQHFSAITEDAIASVHEQERAASKKKDFLPG